MTSLIQCFSNVNWNHWEHQELVAGPAARRPYRLYDVFGIVDDDLRPQRRDWKRNGSPTATGLGQQPWALRHIDPAGIQGFSDWGRRLREDFAKHFGYSPKRALLRVRCLGSDACSSSSCFSFSRSFGISSSSHTRQTSVLDMTESIHIRSGSSGGSLVFKCRVPGIGNTLGKFMSGSDGVRLEHRLGCAAIYTLLVLWVDIWRRKKKPSHTDGSLGAKKESR
jgi:hypothetical protein